MTNELTPEGREMLASLPADQQELFASWANPPELDAELAAHVYTDEVLGWEMLKHPLVFSIPYMPQMNLMLNQQLYQKQEALSRAIDSGDWHTFVWMHERPYRVDAFCEIMDRMEGKDYWSLLSSMWMDSENIRENYQVWEDLLANDMPDRHAFMSEDDHAAYDALPDTITVWQGHTLDRDDGWSWTTDEPKAVWFARRFGNMENATPVVTEATVDKSDVTGYLLGRGESEILADPALVVVIRSYAPGEPDADD